MYIQDESGIETKLYFFHYHGIAAYIFLFDYVTWQFFINQWAFMTSMDELKMRKVLKKCYFLYDKLLIDNKILQFTGVCHSGGNVFAQ